MRFQGLNSPIMLIGNQSGYLKREVTLLKGEILAQKHGCLLLETSAKLDTNINEAFRSVLTAMQQGRNGGLGNTDTWARVGPFSPFFNFYAGRKM